MRRFLRRILPSHTAVSGNRWLAPFENSLLHPRLWHVNRRSAAGAVAVGLFCGLIPGPLQVASSALLCVLFRVNLPIAILMTFYTNPFTIVPLYLVAFELGSFALNGNSGFEMPPDKGAGGYFDWIRALVDWALTLGQPLAFGIFLLASLLAAMGYATTRAAWRAHLVYTWHQRRRAT